MFYFSALFSVFFLSICKKKKHFKTIQAGFQWFWDSDRTVGHSTGQKKHTTLRSALFLKTSRLDRLTQRTPRYHYLYKPTMAKGQWRHSLVPCTIRHSSHQAEKRQNMLAFIRITTVSKTPCYECYFVLFFQMNTHLCCHNLKLTVLYNWKPKCIVCPLASLVCALIQCLLYLAF